MNDQFKCLFFSHFAYKIHLVIVSLCASPLVSLISDVHCVIIINKWQ